AAVVLHLEGQAGIAVAVGIRRRREHQLVGGDVGHGDEVAGGDGAAVERQAAGARQRGDLDLEEVVGRAVVRIGEAKVRRIKGIGGVLQRGDAAVGAGGRVVHTGDVDGERVGGGVEVDAAIGGAAVVLHLEGQAGIAVAVLVGIRHKGELAEVNVGFAHE